MKIPIHIDIQMKRLVEPNKKRVKHENNTKRIKKLS